LKNGKTEKYDLTNKTERKNFEEKYGKLVSVGSTIDGVISPVSAISTGMGQTVIAPMNPVMSGVTWLDDEGNVLTGAEDILVTITKKTTQQELGGFIKLMKERGIELKFDNTDYNDGRLVAIGGTIKFKDSHGSFSATDFNKVILSTITKGEHVYFKVQTTGSKIVI
jgi:hypothetical protein